MEPIMTTTVYERRQNAAYKLNADAYEQTKRKVGKSITYTPCHKADVLIFSKETHIGILETEVLATECHCHPGLTHDELLAMEFDPTAKHKHWDI
jgi:hypothetical protein